MKKLIAVGLIVAPVALSGCMTTQSGGSPLSMLSGQDPTADLGTPINQVEGKVLKVKAAKVKLESNGLVDVVSDSAEREAQGRAGAAAAAVPGGSIFTSVAGELINKASDSIKANAAEEDGIMVTIRTSSGEILSVAQRGEVSDFSKGDRALVNWYDNGFKLAERL